MNRRIVFSTTGKIMCLVALLMLIPSVVAVIYSEKKQLFAFLITAAAAFLLGFLLTLAMRTKNQFQQILMD